MSERSRTLVENQTELRIHFLSAVVYGVIRCRPEQRPFSEGAVENRRLLRKMSARPVASPGQVGRHARKIEREPNKTVASVPRRRGGDGGDSSRPIFVLRRRARLDGNVEFASVRACAPCARRETPPVPRRRNDSDDTIRCYNTMDTAGWSNRGEARRETKILPARAQACTRYTRYCVRSPVTDGRTGGSRAANNEHRQRKINSRRVQYVITTHVRYVRSVRKPYTIRQRFIEHNT